MTISRNLVFILLISIPIFISCGDDDEGAGEPNVIDQVVNKRWVTQSIRFEICNNPSIFQEIDCQDPEENCDSFELTDSSFLFINSGEVEEEYSFTRLNENTIEACDYPDDCINMVFELNGDELTLTYEDGEGDDCERTIVIALPQ